ncbi:MAG: VacB/RNase II family 3'-5' exoribonuclease [Bryobacterales bacterium]|nr:VacB/RNase II family 3'-5' exoribonuclease [Bryobacterales bacterium]
MTDAAVLAHIAKLPHSRATFRQLIRELGSKGVPRDDLARALNRLEARGELIEFRSGQYVVAAKSREYAAGRLNVHRDGYGFLLSDKPLEGIAGDVFLPPDAAAKAMHGDRVLVRIGRIDSAGRAEGEIVRVLERMHRSVVGEFRITRKGCFVVPHDERVRHWIEIPDGMEIPPPTEDVDRVGAEPPRIESVEDLQGMIVTAELLDFPGEETGAVGRVIEVLGYPDDFGVDVEIIIRKHHLPHRFPPDALEQAAAYPGAPGSDDLADRRDFRGLPVVTIDGETARDFDDAVRVERLPNGHYALDVHIADVSHYVRPGSPIDREARLRGTSAYFPDRAVPMLPRELSTALCSLVPREDRLVLSALLEIDRQGDCVRAEFTRGVIRSAERLTYTSVHKLLEGDDAERERYAAMVGDLELMRELALVLNRKRVRRGSIDFDLPEPLIEFDEFGEMVGVIRAPRNIAHRIIEEFMLAANEAVAARLEAAGIASIYRIHELPDPKRVLDFEEAASQFGYSLGLGALPVKKYANTQHYRDGRKVRREISRPEAVPGLTSRHYQKMLARLEGKPEERIVNYLLLRSLKQARYSVDNAGHFALAAGTYTHFTSPIRRYPDLLVHRLLKGVLDGASTPGEDDLRAAAEDCSRAERRAADAERELVEWKKAKFMAERVGDVFDALVIGTAKYGLFVELESLFVEGLVPVETLPGDRYTYRENTRQVMGERTRRAFSIGDRLRVCLDRVEETGNKLQFSVFEEAPRKRRR